MQDEITGVRRRFELPGAGRPLFDGRIGGEVLPGIRIEPPGKVRTRFQRKRHWLTVPVDQLDDVLCPRFTERQCVPRHVAGRHEVGV